MTDVLACRCFAMNRFVVAAGAALCLLPSSPGVADEPCRTGLSSLRYEDDVACFRALDVDAGILGRLKFIPITGDGAVSLSFGGELRQRYEFTDNPVFGQDRQDEAGVWLQRAVLHGDLRVGQHVRVFAQLFSALEAGREGGPSPVDENRLALQNGFVDFRFAPVERLEATVRAGRQELQYGSGRLVDVREGPNVRRTFDAARAILEARDWRVDGLAARPRAVEPGVFDDEANDDQALWGVYATGGRELLPAGRLDLYYLGFRDDAGVFEQGAAEETRHSIGARVWGESGAWDWNWEAVFQFGSFGDGEIRAWTLASATGRTWTDLPWRPRVGVSANIASGDRDPDDADLQTFNPLFPRGNYFSEAAVLGPRNFVNIQPSLTVSPAERWSVTADVNAFWRLETEDGVYAPSGQLVRASGGSGERFVGTSASLAVTYSVSDHLSLGAIYTHFAAGDFIEATGPSDDIDFIELTATFRF